MGTETVLVTGANGQVGSHLCEYLLALGHRVVGAVRRSSGGRLDNLTGCVGRPLFEVAECDVTDPFSVRRLLSSCCPTVVVNLAAQSHVHTSFEQPHYTFETISGAVLNWLEAIRGMDEGNRPRFWNASTSEMFGTSYSVGTSSGSPFDAGRAGRGGPHYQDEDTPFRPNSPYAVSKLAAHNLVRLYRESYGIWACSGILFNMEGPRRGPNFVTRKITKYIARWAKTRLDGSESPPPLRLGNLKAERDWNWVGDSVRAIWTMARGPEPEDYVVSTGESHTVEEFLQRAFSLVCPFPSALPFEVDPSLFRPSEVPYLRGSSRKIREELGWEPSVGFAELVKRMVESDLAAEGISPNQLPVRA
jgi:GDPmannose 4,6-dehydratase